MRVLDVSAPDRFPATTSTGKNLRGNSWIANAIEVSWRNSLLPLKEANGAALLRSFSLLAC
jgi:hypothetical protein